MWNEQQQPEAPVEFVPKLYQMLESPRFKNIVSWSETRDSFVILDMTAFQQEVIPQVFNHSNYSSFVRQLNKYDFHKVRFRDTQSKIWEFQHPDFRPENSDRPHLIKRKVPSSRTTAVHEVVGEVQAQLVQLQNRLEKVEGENRQLWDMVNTHNNMLNRLYSDMRLDHTHTLPPPPPQAMIAPPEPQQQAPVALLAMDDANARALSAKFLQQYGCAVDVASNGRDLLKFADVATYKYIIMDLVLEQVDGLYATDIIRTTDSTVPIILVLEASRQSMPTQDYVKRGVSAILRRPFTKSMLYEILDAWSR